MYNMYLSTVSSKIPFKPKKSNVSLGKHTQSIGEIANVKHLYEQYS